MRSEEIRTLQRTSNRFQAINIFLLLIFFPAHQSKRKKEWEKEKRKKNVNFFGLEFILGESLCKNCKQNKQTMQTRPDQTNRQVKSLQLIALYTWIWINSFCIFFFVFFTICILASRHTQQYNVGLCSQAQRWTICAWQVIVCLIDTLAERFAC